MTEIADRIVARDTRTLARAATWIENRRPEAEALLKELFPRTGRALVLGVTGAAGSGKSTLCDRFASELRAQNKTVAILAVDPTSPYSGGALLGDRIRMQRHHDDPGVFIRSMATRGWLGGLARATTEITILLDAAGFAAPDAHGKGLSCHSRHSAYTGYLKKIGDMLRYRRSR